MTEASSSAVAVISRAEPSGGERVVTLSPFDDPEVSQADRRPNASFEVPGTRTGPKAT